MVEELLAHQQRLGEAPPDAEDDDPREQLRRIIGYLNNNRQRMDYASYRCAGLPTTSAWMESAVKEINYRTKGTEMFWNHPAGAEAILQIQAASLSDDDRLARVLAQPDFARDRTSPLSQPEITIPDMHPCPTAKPAGGTRSGTLVRL